MTRRPRFCAAAEHHLTFEVYGADAAEVHARALNRLDAYAEAPPDDPAGTTWEARLVRLDVAPTVVAGSGEIVSWQASVTAVLRPEPAF